MIHMFKYLGETEMEKFDQIELGIESKLKGICGEEICIQKDTVISDTGIDSLVFVQFIVEIEDEYGVEIPFEKLSIDELGTITELAELVYHLQKSNVNNKEFE